MSMVPGGPGVSDHEIVAALRPALHDVICVLINAGRSKDEAFEDVRQALSGLEGDS